MLTMRRPVLVMPCALPVRARHNPTGLVPNVRGSAGCDSGCSQDAGVPDAVSQEWKHEASAVNWQAAGGGAWAWRVGGYGPGG